MHRLIFEIPPIEVKRWFGPIYEKAEIFSVYILKYDEKILSGIFKIRFRNQNERVKNLINRRVVVHAELVSRDRDGRLTCIIKIKHHRWKIFRYLFDSPDLTLDRYLVMRDGNLRITLLGQLDSLRDFGDAASVFKIKYKIIKIAKFGEESVLSTLTPKQRKILRTAYELGYFETPKRVTLERISAILGLNKSTVMEHLRKAEKRILDAVL
jgi:predicted DNA binding protein